VEEFCQALLVVAIQRADRDL
jgi:hypothetical protein